MLISKLKEVVKKIGKDVGDLRTHISYEFKTLEDNYKVYAAHKLDFTFNGFDVVSEFPALDRNTSITTEKYTINEFKSNEKLLISFIPDADYVFQEDVAFCFSKIVANLYLKNSKITSAEMYVTRDIFDLQDVSFFEIPLDFEGLFGSDTDKVNDLTIELELYSDSKAVVIPQVFLHVDNRRYITQLLSKISFNNSLINELKSSIQGMQSSILTDSNKRLLGSLEKHTNPSVIDFHTIVSDTRIIDKGKSIIENRDGKYIVSLELDRYNYAHYIGFDLSHSMGGFIDITYPNNIKRSHNIGLAGTLSDNKTFTLNTTIRPKLISQSGNTKRYEIPEGFSEIYVFIYGNFTITDSFDLTVGDTTLALSFVNNTTGIRRNLPKIGTVNQLKFAQSNSVTDTILNLLKSVSELKSNTVFVPGKYGTSTSELPTRQSDLSVPVQGLGYYDITSRNRPSSVNSGVLVSFSKDNTNSIPNNNIAELSFSDNNIINFRQWNNGQDSGWHEILTTRTLPSRNINSNSVMAGRNITYNGAIYASPYYKQWYKFESVMPKLGSWLNVSHKFPNFKKITNISYRIDDTNTSYFSGLNITVNANSVNIKNESTVTALQAGGLPVHVYIEVEN